MEAILITETWPNLSERVFIATGGVFSIFAEYSHVGPMLTSCSETNGSGAGVVSLSAIKSPAKIFFSVGNSTNAEDLVTRFKQNSVFTEVIFVECDYASLASVHTAVKRFLAWSSRLYIIVCNAGIIPCRLELVRMATRYIRYESSQPRIVHRACSA